MMDCGQEIRVKDFYGAYSVRFIAQCHGRYILIGHGHPMNGFMMADWRAVLRELVALTVPAALMEKTHLVESTINGTYNGMRLNYPLSARGIADVLGVPADEVNGELEDLKVAIS